MWDLPELAQGVMDQGDCGLFGGGDVPALAKKVDLVVGVHAAFQMQCQMQVQQSGWRAGTGGGAFFCQGFLPGGVGAQADGAADGGILALDFPLEHDLRGGIAVDFFIGQDGPQAFLQGAKAAFDLAFGLRAGSDQMGDAQRGEGALELRAGIAVIGHGIMAKQAQAVGIDHHGQAVLEEQPAKVLEVVPRRVGGHKDRAQESA